MRSTVCTAIALKLYALDLINHMSAELRTHTISWFSDPGILTVVPMGPNCLCQFYSNSHVSPEIKIFHFKGQWHERMSPKSEGKDFELFN